MILLYDGSSVTAEFQPFAYDKEIRQENFRN